MCFCHCLFWFLFSDHPQLYSLLYFYCIKDNIFTYKLSLFRINCLFLNIFLLCSHWSWIKWCHWFLSRLSEVTFPGRRRENTGLQKCRVCTGKETQSAACRSPTFRNKAALSYLPGPMGPWGDQRALASSFHGIVWKIQTCHFLMGLSKWKLLWPWRKKIVPCSGK